MLKISECIEINIEKIVFGGEGLGFYNNFAIFVPMSIPGDKLLVKIISLKKTYARALIEKILIASPDRINDGRVSFKDFSGCDFAMLKYPEQLKYKQIMLSEVLTNIAKIAKIENLKIAPSEDIYNYRNKIIEPFGIKNGKIISGFYDRKSHNIFEVEENILNSKLGNLIIKTLKEILNRNKISVYDEKTHRGILRNIMLRTNSKNEAMVVLIVNDKKINILLKEILNELKKKIKEIKSVYISYNTKKGNTLLGEKQELIFGDKFLQEEIFGIKFNISPNSFFQINPAQTKKLYELALSYFKTLDDKNIIDAYSGTGTLAMIMSKKAKKIFAIEYAESASNDGIKTAQENNIKNIKFINGKVEEKIFEIVKKEKIDGIIFDPPRKGLDKIIIDVVAKSLIKEIVYISCNPSTLARDIKLFIENGYQLEKIEAVDMFPQTAHIETVVLLSKIKN